MVRRHNTTSRRGSTAVLAMIFLILISCLAIGFFFQVTTSVETAGNERRINAAQLAAESGLQFVRYQLAAVDIPAGTSDANMAAALLTNLQAKLESTANLGAAHVTRSGNVITLPPITADSGGAGTKFSGTIEWVPVASPGTSYLRATVNGLYGSGATQVTRAVRLDYNIKSKPTTLFNFGIASKGAVTIKQSVSTKVLGTPGSAASILSASAGAISISTGKGAIDGNLAVVLNKNQVSLGGGSVGGATSSQLILSDHVSVVPSPSFPVVDTTPFKALAVNTYSSSSSHQKNIRVPPNTNPRFNGGDIIDGILYVESPNAVTFRGNATINGIIVFENKNTSASNSLDFKGNVTPANIPAAAEFNAIRAAAKGWAILAPTASVSMSGSVDGNVDGTIMADKVAFNGSADLTLNHGSVISLGSNVTDISGKVLKFVGSGADNPPTTGLTFNGSFFPNPASYYEP
jgi:hypothetical protein